MANLYKIEKEHDGLVERYRCGECKEEFDISSAIVVDYCPRCGAEFQSEFDESPSRKP